MRLKPDLPNSGQDDYGNLKDGPKSDREPYPRVAPGVYQARCVGAKTYVDPMFRRHTCKLDFILIDSENKICGFLNLGVGKDPKAGSRSRYRAAWIIASGR